MVLTTHHKGGQAHVGNRSFRFVIWICSKFTRAEIEQLAAGLSDVLQNRNPDVRPKDDFKERHPNYRKFSVDPNTPLTEPSVPKKVHQQKDFKELPARYLVNHGNPLKPIKRWKKSLHIPQLKISGTSLSRE